MVYNMHSLVDLLAPARSVTSSAVGGGYGTASGTSISAPMVAGAFALCRSVNPSLTVDQIEIILEDTGVPVTDIRPGGLYIKPRLQMDAAITACRHTNSWTGNRSIAWSDPANWSDGVVPTSVTDVTIDAPPAGGQSPTLDVAAAVHTLTVESGALLDLGNQTITVEETVTNNGTLRQTKDVAPGTSRFSTITNAVGDIGKYWGVDITTPNRLHATTVAISGNQFCPVVVDEAVRRCFEISPAVQQTAVRHVLLPCRGGKQQPDADCLALGWRCLEPAAWKPGRQRRGAMGHDPQRQRVLTFHASGRSAAGS